jgi:metallo-beta-lactamase family protein
MKLHFYGGTRQVTGSSYMLEAGGLRMLVDCGMYQEREFLSRNWGDFPFAPDSLDYVLLTHAHLDHSGLIPKLVRDGFAGRILTTSASRDLTEIVLYDAAEIQEEDAAFKRRRHERERRKGPYPVVPLYTSQDVRSMMPLFQRSEYGQPTRLNDRVTVTYHDAGHILGSAMVAITVTANGVSRSVVFSGDIGQWQRPILRDPTVFEQADYVVMESTYGNRDHEDLGAVQDQLAEIINTTVAEGGNVVIPTFAIERAQELMYHIGALVREDRIPHLLAFLDSPMALSVTEVFERYHAYMDEEALRRSELHGQLFRFPGLQMVRSPGESKAINRIRGSCIIMAGSGMCTAGRIKHHLVNNLPRRESSIVFAGYQAPGTLGRRIVSGEPVVRVLGAEYPVQAGVRQIHGLSAHADRHGLVRWLSHFREPARRVFVTHGEEEAANELAGRIRSKKGWRVDVPRYRAVHDLE